MGSAYYERGHEKRGENQEGMCYKMVTESKARQRGSTTRSTSPLEKTRENTRYCHATLKTRQVEATSGSASRPARGSTGTLAAHGAGEERRGKRRHHIRGRSGLNTVRGGGQPGEDVVRVSGAQLCHLKFRLLYKFWLPGPTRLEIEIVYNNTELTVDVSRRSHNMPIWGLWIKAYAVKPLVRTSTMAVTPHASS
jgi:hypothetical protein